MDYVDPSRTDTFFNRISEQGKIDFVIDTGLQLAGTQTG